MSITRRIFFGAAASWFSRGMTILMGLILMPVLFRTLPQEELGLWMLIGQSVAVLGILDFGFGVTLTRRLAFARARSGSDPTAPFTEESRSEIADLLTTGSRLYRILAVVAFVVSFGSGFFYLRTLHLEAVALTTIWTAWSILCLSNALTVWATPWTCLLQGVGHVGWDALVASFTGVITLTAQIVTALAGGGIVALSIVAAAGALLQRLAILGFARRKQPELFELSGNWRGEIVREMVPLAWRAWLTAMGAALVLYTDQFVIASMQGSTEIPAYRAAWVIVHNLTIVAITFSSASGVFVSHLWQSGERDSMHRLIERNLRIGWLVMLAGSSVLFFAGKDLFDLWLGEGHFIGYPILLAFVFTEMLEAQAFIVSTGSRATGEESFAWSSILGGVLKLGLSVFLAREWGLLGVALGTVIALSLTNHWYVPWKGLARMEYSRVRLLTRTIGPALIWSAVAAALLYLVHALLGDTPSWVRLLALSSLAVLSLVGSLWTLVLSREHRHRLIAGWIAGPSSK